MTDERVNYTAALVVDQVTKESDGTTTFTPAWTPLVNGFRTIVVDGKEVEFKETFTNKYTKEQLATVKTRTFKLITKDEVKFVDKVPTDAAEGTKVAYKYDNVEIPQNDLPIVNAHMEGIALAAKARRVAIKCM